MLVYNTLFSRILQEGNAYFLENFYRGGTRRFPAPAERFAFPPIPLYRENEKGTAHAVPLPSTDMSVAQQQQLPQLPQPPQVLSPQVPQEPQLPLP